MPEDQEKSALDDGNYVHKILAMRRRGELEDDELPILEVAHDRRCARRRKQGPCDCNPKIFVNDRERPSDWRPCEAPTKPTDRQPRKQMSRELKFTDTTGDDMTVRHHDSDHGEPKIAMVCDNNTEGDVASILLTVGDVMVLMGYLSTWLREVHVREECDGDEE